MNTSLAFNVLMYHQLLNIYLNKKSKKIIKTIFFYFYKQSQNVFAMSGACTRTYSGVLWVTGGTGGDRGLQ